MGWKQHAPLTAAVGAIVIAQIACAAWVVTTIRDSAPSTAEIERQLEAILHTLNH